MKRFIVRLSLFFLILVVCDFALGGAFKLYEYTRHGYLHIAHQLMTKVEPDILILGSSRASHHYVPSILRDSLNLSVYNGGVEAQGTPLAYGFYKGVCQRKIPKMVICDLQPYYDLFDHNDPALDFLYPYLETDGVEDLILGFYPTETFKLSSNAYRLNSRLLGLADNYFHGQSVESDGYVPLHNRMYTTNCNIMIDDNLPPINPEKERWLRTLIEECDANGSEIVFFISPMFYGDISSFSDELSIIGEYGKPVFDHLNDTLFLNDQSLFQNVTHLNDEGAKKYSSIVAREIHELLDSKQP